MTLEQTGIVVAIIGTAFGLYLGLRRLRKEQKDARIEVLEETNRVIGQHRDELQSQVDRQQREIVSLRQQLEAQQKSLEVMNKMVTAEGAIAELRGTMMAEFKQVKGLLGNHRKTS